MVGLWTASQPFAHRARSSLARVGWRRSVVVDEDGMQKKPLYYSPWKGTFYFIYNKHLFWFRSVEEKLGILTEEVVTVPCFGSPTILKQFFNDCRGAYLKLTKNKTTIFEHRGGKWKRTNLKSIRPVSTIVMNEEDKKGLLQDIESFLEPKAPTWHANRGIPYRKGYLLYGPPGTGKSSLCLSLAGRFELGRLHPQHLCRRRSLTGRSFRGTPVPLSPPSGRCGRRWRSATSTRRNGHHSSQGRCHPEYACQYWVYHLKESRGSVRDSDPVHSFLTGHLLHWLEALGLLGRISESIGIVDDLLALLDVCCAAYPRSESVLTSPNSLQMPLRYLHFSAI